MSGSSTDRVPAAITVLPAGRSRDPSRRAPRHEVRDLGESLALWLADVAAEAVTRDQLDAPELADRPDWPEAG
jgi:hypothetical protein